MKIEKDKVIFELPFENYLYGKATTLQEVNENFYEDYYDRDVTDYDLEYIDKNEAIDYLKKEHNATDEELEALADEIESEIKRSAADAWGYNYENEWLTQYAIQLQEQMFKDIPTTAILEPQIIKKDGGINFDMYENKTYTVTVSKKEIEKYKEDDLEETDEELYERYEDEVLLEEVKEFDTKYIDYYGTLGSYDNWIEIFKDNGDSAYLLKELRKDKQERKTSPERLKNDLKDYAERLNNLNEDLHARLKEHEQYSDEKIHALEMADRLQLIKESLADTTKIKKGMCECGSTRFEVEECIIHQGNLYDNGGKLTMKLSNETPDGFKNTVCSECGATIIGDKDYEIEYD